MRPFRALSSAIGLALIGVVVLYRRLLSPLLPPTCRFTPTCSQYMVEAIHKKGPLVGLVKGMFRLLRCNPFCKGGHDPVD